MHSSPEVSWHSARLKLQLNCRLTFLLTDTPQGLLSADKDLLVGHGQGTNCPLAEGVASTSYFGAD